MKHSTFAMSRTATVAFLGQSRLIHLLGAGPDGTPLLHTLDGVVVDGRLCVHASGLEALLGRPVVVHAEEVVGLVPSTFTDGALPATTLLRSVQVPGTLEALETPELEARVLEALRQRLQPEGGHQTISRAHLGDASSSEGLRVAGVSLERLHGEARLAQDRSPTEKTQLVEWLWARGGAGDARAIELLREANPDLTPPAFLSAPGPGALHPWLPESRVDEAAALVADEYWNVGRFSLEALRQAFLGSSAWVGATDGAGRLIATARAIADHGKYAWIYDVGVAAEHHRRGWGKALLRLLLEHPAVRGCRRVLLSTRDAQPFYAKLGFGPRTIEPPRPYTSTEMVLLREG